MQPFIQKYEIIIIRIIVAVGGLLALFLLVATINKIKENRYVGSGVPAGQTITVTGKGELNRSPDTAKVTFTVRSVQSQVKAAQKAVSDKVDAITKALKDLGIDEKYIKTDSYSSYPQYSYNEVTCLAIGCPKPGTPRITGYEVAHTVTVSVKDLDNTDAVLGALGTAGVSEISGPNFGFEDDEAVQREARDLAIEDAKEQAELLARSLGVKLVRLASFSEQGNYPYLYREVMASNQAKDGAAVPPALPVGEQEVAATVTLTYEIR